MAVDPNGPNTLYLATIDDADGEYSLLKSNDGGASWNNIWDARNGLEAGVNALVIDPVNSAILYAGTGPTSYAASAGLFKSLDAGASWSNIGFERTAVTVLTMDRTDPGILYASTEGYNPTGFRGLFKTANGGETWSKIGIGLEPLTGIGATITALVIAPDNPDTLYAATSGDGVYESQDGGLNWTKFNDGLKSLDVRALALAPGTPVYATTSGGVFRLVD